MMRKVEIARRGFLGGGAGFLCAATTAARAPAFTSSVIRPGLTDRLDLVIEGAVACQQIVGAVVMVASGGHVVYQRAAGLSDREKCRKMRLDDVFRLASMTKPLVTTAAMRLVEQGALRLDDPITKWLPWFTPHMPNGTRPVITIEQLLTHSSGLSYALFQGPDSDYRRLGISDGLDSTPGLTLEADLRRLGQTELLFRPGSGWHYGLSLDVIGAVIARATRQKLPDAIETLVLRPLGMRGSGFVASPGEALVVPYTDGTPPVRITPDVPVPFGWTFVHLSPNRAWDPGAFPSAGGGMIGTASDFMRFLAVIRNGGAPLLSKSTIAVMVEDHVGPSAATQGPGWGFGIGWAVLDDPHAAHTPQAAGTIQWGGAYGHIWFLDRVNDLSIVALTNTTPEGMSGHFTTAVRNAIYGV